MYPPRSSSGKSWGMLCPLCHNQNCWSTGLPVTVQLSVWLGFILTLCSVNITFKLQKLPWVTLFMMRKWVSGQEILNWEFLKLLLLACSTFCHPCFTLTHWEHLTASKHLTGLDRLPFEYIRKIKTVMSPQCHRWMIWCFSPLDVPGGETVALIWGVMVVVKDSKQAKLHDLI